MDDTTVLVYIAKDNMCCRIDFEACEQGAIAFAVYVCKRHCHHRAFSIVCRACASVFHVCGYVVIYRLYVGARGYIKLYGEYDRLNQSQSAALAWNICLNTIHTQRQQFNQSRRDFCAVAPKQCRIVVQM